MKCVFTALQRLFHIFHNYFMTITVESQFNFDPLENKDRKLLKNVNTSMSSD